MGKDWFYNAGIGLKAEDIYGDGFANSVDPDQTAPLGAVWSGSALFVPSYLSYYLRLFKF